MKLSILTVSKRTGWEEVAIQSIAKQTFRDFEWVVVATEQDTFELLSGYATVIHAPPKIHATSINAATNEGLRNCKGKYVLFYQDFIELEPDTVEKLYKRCEETNGLITTACIDHQGRMDLRYSGNDDFRLVTPNDWEINVGIAPMQALYDVGGFDERLDEGWSWDNVLVARKADLLGYKTYIDETVKPQLLFHPKETDVNPNLIPNGERCEQIMRNIYQKHEPIKANYLL